MKREMYIDRDDDMFDYPVYVMPGRLAIGPIKGLDGEGLLKRLQEYSLYIPQCDGASMSMRNTSAGVTVEVEGPGVFGYLIDEDGFQAPETKLEDFADTLLEYNDRVVISGEHLVDPDIKVLCKTVIRIRTEGVLYPVPFAEVFVTRVGAGIGVDNMQKG